MGISEQSTQTQGYKGQRGVEKQTWDQTRGRPRETCQERKKRGPRAIQRNGRDSHQEDGQGGDRAPRRGTERTRGTYADTEAPMAKPKVLPNPRSISG